MGFLQKEEKQFVIILDTLYSYIEALSLTKKILFFKITLLINLIITN